MKKMTVLLLMIVMASGVNAQNTNIFPLSGYVGIGTITPQENLHVIGTALISGRAASGYAWFNNQNGKPAFMLNNGTANVLKFAADAAADSYIDAGNFGIGITNPLAKLHVAGSAIITAGAASGYAMIGTQNNKAALLLHDGSSYLVKIAVDPSTDSYFNAGNVGIGTTSPTEKLSVNGTISAKKIKITQSGWSDYVFDKKYKLASLSSLEAYIHKNKHLPDMPSAKEVEEKGISVGDNQVLLLKKIEELTLYMIRQQKQIDAQQNEIRGLKYRINRK